MNRRSFFGKICAVFIASILAARKAFAENFQILDYGETDAEGMKRQEWNAFEAAWVAAWRHENNPPGWLNCGRGPLQVCLGRIPTDAERKAVARIIQWFGSNCGSEFIRSALEMQGCKVPFFSGPAYEALHAARHEAVWTGKPHKRVLVKFRWQRMWI